MNGLWMDIWKVDISNIQNPIHLPAPNPKQVVTGHSGHSGHRWSSASQYFKETMLKGIHYNPMRRIIHYCYTGGLCACYIIGCHILVC